MLKLWMTNIFVWTCVLINIALLFATCVCVCTYACMFCVLGVCTGHVCMPVCFVCVPDTCVCLYVLCAGCIPDTCVYACMFCVYQIHHHTGFGYMKLNSLDDNVQTFNIVLN